MERAGAECHHLPREKRRAGAVVLKYRRCRTPFSPDVSAGTLARSERIDGERRPQPALAGSPAGPGDRGCLVAGNPFALENDAGACRRFAPGGPEYFPAPPRDAL